MKKLLTATLLISGAIFLTSCATTPSNYSEVRQMGYKYTALAESESLIGQNRGVYSSSDTSQYEANNSVLEYCKTIYNDCVLVFESERMVYVSTEEKNRKAIETSLANANNKARNECISLGIVEGSKEYADCNLKLSSIYKEEAIEEQKIVLAEQQAAAAKRQAIAAKEQAAAQQQLANEKSYQDSMSLIRQGQRMMSGGCTLGINC